MAARVVPKMGSSYSRSSSRKSKGPFPSSLSKSTSAAKLHKSTSFANFQPMSFEEKLRRYRAIFDSIDIDRSGTLDPEELDQAVVALGFNEDEVTVHDIFGVSGEDSLTFDDFVVAMEAYEKKLSEELAQEEAGSDDYDDDDGSGDDDSNEGAPPPALDVATAAAYRKLFQDLDIKRTGKLTAEDLHTYIRNLSLREASMSSEELNFYFALVEEADNSEDGFVDIEGFAEVAEFHQDFIDTYKNRNDAKTARMSRGMFLSAYSSRGSRASKANLSNEDLEMYRAVFNEFDLGKTGIVRDTDVTAMMNRLGRVPTEEESEFLFELLQLVGEDGFNFDDYMDLMQDGPEGLGVLGKNINIWKGKGPGQNQRPKSIRKVAANVSRMGLRTGIQRESSHLQAEDVRNLERINGRLSKDGGARQQGDAFGAGFTFLPTAAPVVAAPPPVQQVPMYPVPSQYRANQSDSMLGYASSLLTPLELLRYRAVFNALDLDRDGRVSVNEMLMSAKTVTGRQPTDEEVQHFLVEADSDHNGTVEFEEFVVMMQKTKRTMSSNQISHPSAEIAMAATKRKLDKYRIVFDHFDANKDGRITPDELKETLRKMGKSSDQSAIQNMFATFDVNKSGALEFEEFVQLMDQLVSKELCL